MFNLGVPAAGGDRSACAPPEGRRCHARVLEGVVKRLSPLKAVVFDIQQPCPDTVSLDLDSLVHSGVVGIESVRESNPSGKVSQARLALF